MADGFEPRFVDLVRNFTTTQGTGDFALGSAVSGFSSFTSALADGDRFYYSAIGIDNPGEREIGRGTLLSGGKVRREPIGGAATNFSSGTKTVALVVPAEWFAAADQAAARTDDVALAAAYGATGDGVADDSAAIADALQSGKKVVFGKPPGGKYRFASGWIIELTKPLDVDFGGHEIEFAGGVLTFTSPKVASGRTLAANAARYATAVTLSSAAGIEAGDLLDVTTSVIAETSWNYTKKDVVKVRSVSGNSVELEEPLMFAYATGDSGLKVEAYRPQRLRLVRPFATTAGVSIMMSFEFLEDIEIVSPKIGGSPNFDPATDTSRIGMRFYGCSGVTIRDAVCESMSYALMPARGTRNTLIDGLTASRCRTAFTPTDWPKGVTVRNLRASDCWQAIDSHPAFHVTVDGFNVERDASISNLRCVRGEVRNGRYHTLAGDSAGQAYHHSLYASANVASYLYADADYRIDNVEILAPNRTLPVIRVENGRRVFVDGLQAPAAALSFSTAALNAVGEVLWGPNNQTGGRPSPSRRLGGTESGVRCPIRIMQPPLLDAYESGGVYHIDPRLQMVDQGKNRLRCHGNIARGLSGASSFVLPIRIHTNAFGNIDSVLYVQGQLRLRARAQHNHAGAFATVEKRFNFFQVAVDVSTLFFPLNPVLTSAPSGQANEGNLSLTIANPSHQGQTQLGPGGDFYAGIEAVVAMGVVASPVFDLDYELELEAVQ